MLLQIFLFFSLALVGLAGLFYIWKAHRVAISGVVVAEKSTISRIDAPFEFKIYVWGRYICGLVLLLSSMTVAFVFMR